MSSGYAAGADDAAFVDGGFLTGDLGALGADGRLRLKGRVSAFVNVAGRKVQPDEVEASCASHPLVADARVFGLPDERRGEQLAACVVAAGTRASGWSRCGRSAPSGWRRTRFPGVLVLVPELPRDERGKVSRKALETLVVGERRRGIALSAGPARPRRAIVLLRNRE